MNIHGARRAGRRRRKVCMDWSWAATCGVQGRGHIARLPAQLIKVMTMLMMSYRGSFGITVGTVKNYGNTV